MYREEKTFLLRFTLEAPFPDDYEGDQDNLIWTKEWESRIKPELLKQIFESLRGHGAWKAHIRNRGISPADEVEIVLTREVVEPPPFSIVS